MTKTALWRSIADEITGHIGSGAYPPGHRLPTEGDLAARYNVNRHTVRRALADLVERGLVHTRRGSGAFVQAKATIYPIGRRVRFHQNLRAAGRVPGKRILALETRPATAEEARALKLRKGEAVHVCDGLSTADGQPIAVFRSVFPAYEGLPDALREEQSVTRALSRVGVDDYTRASTRLTARGASATQALHLKLREGAPVLCSESVNLDAAGRPCEFGLTWFSGETVTLTFEGS
jgi:GntR family phosphonate transport system transcriptional regulator